MYDELYHHGIKGQKWGLRRFQNKDGTRTALGKKRERAGGFGAAIKRIAAKRKKAKLLKKAREANLAKKALEKMQEEKRKKIMKDPGQVRKHIDEFSTAELKDIQTRLEIDKKLADLQKDKITRGKDYIATAANVLSNSINIYNGISAAMNTMNEQAGRTDYKKRILINTNASQDNGDKNKK